MKRTLFATSAVTGLGVALVAFGTTPVPAQQKTVKIGFVSTFSGAVAAIGADMRNSFELAKLAGR